MPDTLVGLILFIAAAGPGYFYLRLAERREPRRERTGLKEAAELGVIGAILTTLAVLLVLTLAQVVRFIDTESLLKRPLDYVFSEPASVLAALACVALLSYGGAWLLYLLIHRGSPAGNIRPESGWYATFVRDRPRDHGVYATVELSDGRSISGIIKGLTAEETPDRELTLVAPANDKLRVRTPDGAVEKLKDAFILLSSAGITYVSGRYVPRKDAAGPTEAAAGRARSGTDTGRSGEEQPMLTMRRLLEMIGVPPNRRRDRTDPAKAPVQAPEFDLTQYAKRLALVIGVIFPAVLAGLRAADVNLSDGIVIAALGVTAASLIGVSLVMATDIGARAYADRSTRWLNTKAALGAGTAPLMTVWIRGEEDPAPVVAVNRQGDATSYLVLRGSTSTKTLGPEKEVSAFDDRPQWVSEDEVTASYVGST